MDIISDLVVTASDLQVINRQELRSEFGNLSSSERNLLTEQVLKLASLLNLNSHIYVGKRVADGIIAGTKTKDGEVYSALIDGPGVHEWRDCENIAL